MNHSKTGASNAHRWLECTKSATLEQEETTSIHAELGTQKHEEAVRYFNGEVETKDDDIINYINWINSNEGVKMLEAKVSISSISDELHGTVDCFIFKDKVLNIVDYKTGSIEVVPNDNPQLIFYALGVIDTYFKDMPINHIYLHIFQRGIKSCELTKGDIIYWRERFKVAFEEVKTSPKYSVGNWCQYCPSIKFCEQAKALTVDVIQTEPVMNMNNMDSQDLYHYLKHKKLAEKFLKACEAEAMKRLKQGRIIEGVKIKAGNRLKRWVDDSKLDYKFFEKKPMTVSSAIKKFGDVDGWTEVRGKESLIIDNEVEFKTVESDLW